MRVVRRSAAWLFISMCAAAEARAGIDFPSVADRAVGVRHAADVFAVPGDGRSWQVEAGDVALFGIAGLRVDGVRAHGRVRALHAGVSIAQLSSTVGSESRGEIELGYRPSARWLCAARAGAETVSIAGALGERALLAGFYSRADAGRIAAVADVDVVARGNVRDVAVSLALIGHVGSVSIVATSQFDGEAVASAGIAIISRFAGRLALLAGYDDGSESIRGAALVSVASFQIGVGVFQHGVLGVSQGVTLSWSH